MKSIIHDINSIQNYESSEKLSRTFSIVVCYRPDIELLNQLCEKLIIDGSRVVLVDNTETPYLEQGILPEGCQFITLGCNKGIAHAQNIGIDVAIQEGGEIIAFFDQDSQIGPGILKSLVSELIIGEPNIVSPRCVDNISHTELPALTVNRYGMAKSKFYHGATSPYLVDIIISSGTTATKEVFQIVGGFDEDLFIDYVDTEWCLRCREKNIPIRVVPSAVMYHRIGMSSVKMGLITVQVHSPERCYYQIRNSFSLFRRSHVPFIFASQSIIYTLVNRFFLLFIVKQKSIYMRTFLRAISDGLMGVIGPK